LNAVGQALIERGAEVEVEAKVIDVTDKIAMANWIESLDERWCVDLVIANAGVSLNLTKARHSPSIAHG
jgi:NADP-dependent 3-hydroxy acid dehydrogenase YdfG